eukprot:scaffold725_cov162-Ochromonas_danica.AAC.7
MTGRIGPHVLPMYKASSLQGKAYRKSKFEGWQPLLCAGADGGANGVLGLPAGHGALHGLTLPAVLPLERARGSEEGSELKDLISSKRERQVDSLSTCHWSPLKPRKE